jgi:hypothetical protein
MAQSKNGEKWDMDDLWNWDDSDDDLDPDWTDTPREVADKLQRK